MLISRFCPTCLKQHPPSCREKSVCLYFFSCFLTFLIDFFLQHIECEIKSRVLFIVRSRRGSPSVRSACFRLCPVAATRRCFCNNCLHRGRTLSEILHTLFIREKRACPSCVCTWTELFIVAYIIMWRGQELSQREVLLRDVNKQTCALVVPAHSNASRRDSPTPHASLTAITKSRFRMTDVRLMRFNETAEV